jgi:hypothetical protein
LGIDPTLIASKATLFALGRHDPEAWSGLMPWQRELLEKAPTTRPKPRGTPDPVSPPIHEPDHDDRQPPICGLD